MAVKLKIKTKENTEIHFEGFGSNYTLCGLETGGDLTLGIHKAIVTRNKATCKHCIRIVYYCHHIGVNEIKES